MRIANQKIMLAMCSVVAPVLFFISCSSPSTPHTEEKISRVNPMVKHFGGIYDLPYATERPDSSLTFNIVVEVQKQSDKPDSLSWALNNVARMLNLHVVGGVPASKVNAVVVIHGDAAYTTMNNEAYRAKFHVDNPNIKLYEELEQAGVKIMVCGQTLILRKIDRNRLVPQVKIATSMLTTLTTYQLKGYAYLRF